MTAAALETREVEALVTDRYLESLLAAASDAPRRRAARPRPLDPTLRAAAPAGRASSCRAPPVVPVRGGDSPRRLAEAAAGGCALAAAVGGEGIVRAVAAGDRLARELADAADRARRPPAADRRRPDLGRPVPRRRRLRRLAPHPRARRRPMARAVRARAAVPSRRDGAELA